MKRAIKGLLFFAAFVFITACSTLLTTAQAASSLSISSPSTWTVHSWDDSLTVKWNSVTGAAGYYITIKNETTGTYLVQNKWTTSRSFSAGGYLPESIAQLKIWVGAVTSSSEAAVEAFTSDIIYIYSSHEPDITNGSASDITETSATLSMTINKDYGFDISDWGFYIGTSSSVSRMDSYSYGYTVKGAKSATITGLSPNTKYYYRAFAVNDAGEEITSYGTFKTKAPVLPLEKAKITTLTNWSEITENESLTVDWYDVAGADGYRIHIKRLLGNPDTSNDNEEAAASWKEDLGDVSSYRIGASKIIGGYWYKIVVETYASDVLSSWSEWYYLYAPEKSVIALDRPVITSPIAGKDYSPEREIVFTWNKVPYATSYTYYIKELIGEPDYSDNEDSLKLWKGTTTSRRCVLSANDVHENRWYKFVVEAKADGCVSGWSYYTYIKIPKNENWIEVTAPKSLQNVESEAYNGNKRLRVYDASQSSLVAIDSKAFYNCTNLIAVKLPATVTIIANDAFSGCSNLTIYCPSGSVAEKFAKAHGIKVELYGIVVEKDLLTLSANNWVIGSANAANKVVSVSSTGTWKAVSSKSWLTVSAASGINGESVVLTASENTGSSERNAKVTFASGSATAVVSVNQSGAQSSVVTPVVAGNWNDPSTITVTLGDQYRLNGSVSVSNGKLGVVSVSVANGSNQALTNNYDGMVSGISLASESAFVIDTAKDSDFAKAGTYSLALYAKAYGSNNAVKIGEKTLVVKSPVVEKAPVVSASLTTNKVNNSGSGKLGVTVTTTYADRFYIEVLNGNTPISISDQWKGTVKKREYNGDDFAVPTLYTAAGKSWGPVYITIPQGTAAGEYTVRVTALNDESGKSSNSAAAVNIIAKGREEISYISVSKSNLSWVINQLNYNDPINDYVYTYNNVKKTIKTSGCGVCALANGMAYITGKLVDIQDLNRYCRDNNGYCVGEGIYFSFIGTTFANSPFAAECGVIRKPVSDDLASYQKHLSTKNGVLIASVSRKNASTQKTADGHILAIVDYDAASGKYLILDSAGLQTSPYEWSGSLHGWHTLNQSSYIGQDGVTKKCFQIDNSRIVVTATWGYEKK